MEREEMEKIVKEVEKEFPGDPALQQIHIARKIIFMEACKKKMSFIEYIKTEVRRKNLMKRG